MVVLTGQTPVQQHARSTVRSETDGAYADLLYSPAEEASNHAIIDAVGQVANAHGVSRAQVALAWLRRQPVVTAPLVGAGLPSAASASRAAARMRAAAICILYGLATRPSPS